MALSAVAADLFGSQRLKPQYMCLMHLLSRGKEWTKQANKIGVTHIDL